MRRFRFELKINFLLKIIFRTLLLNHLVSLFSIWKLVEEIVDEVNQMVLKIYYLIIKTKISNLNRIFYH